MSRKHPAWAAQQEKEALWRIVSERDGMCCRWCGRYVVRWHPITRFRATLDHVKPRALGGSNNPANIVIACQPCNVARPVFVSASPPITERELVSLMTAED